jgi:hypothetical protein
MSDHYKPENRATNRMTAGAQAADQGSGRPESGMPAGGPEDLAIRSHESASEKAEEPADPFGSGIDARASGLGLDDCPYPHDSDEGRIWQDGWNHRSGFEAAV